MLIERKILTEGWNSFKDVEFETFEAPVEIKDVTMIINYAEKYKVATEDCVCMCMMCVYACMRACTGL